MSENKFVTGQEINEGVLETKWRPYVSGLLNEKFIYLQPYCSYGLYFADPEASPYHLPVDVSNSDLGEAVIGALKQSRWLPYEASEKLYAGNSERYEVWVQDMMQRYGYKSKRALFKGMKCCFLVIKEDKIEMRPTIRKGEGWGRDKSFARNDVHIPYDSPPAEIGAALRLAFERCIG